MLKQCLHLDGCAGRETRCEQLVPRLARAHLSCGRGQAGDLQFAARGGRCPRRRCSRRQHRTDIVAVLGPEGREVASSGDPVADAAARERFVTAFEEKHEINQPGDTRATLVLGNDDFPFPIPIVQEGGAWRFDTAEGKEEILDRRIGENELAAIEVLQCLRRRTARVRGGGPRRQRAPVRAPAVEQRRKDGRPLLADRRRGAREPVRSARRGGACRRL